MSALPCTVDVPPLRLVAPIGVIPDCERLLQPLAAGTSALLPIGNLPALWRMTETEAATSLARLVGDDLVELWPDAPDGPSCILAQICAAELGLVLEPIGDGWRWVERGRLPPNKTKAVVLSSIGTDGVDADQYEDRKALDPHKALERQEAELAKPAKRRTWSGVFLLIGADHQWPDALTVSPCPACRGGLLPAGMVCLCCLERPVWEDRHKARPKPRAYRADPKRAGGTGTAKPAKRGKVKAEKGRGYRHPKRRV